jgi:hypothetical protein
MPVTAAAQEAPAAAPAIAPDVQAFLAFAEGSAGETLPLGHEYTARGLRLLAAALQAAGIPDSTGAARALSLAAVELARDPQSLRHADVAREAFIAAARALGDARVLAAAQALSAADPMRSQARRVDRFFDEAAAALSHPPSARA